MISREIDIEFRLTKHLNGSEFERFGNQYLRYYYKNKYPQTKLGSQIANNSTVAGQPDMFFSLPGHKFKLAEITKKKDNLTTKLKNDLNSCLDEELHGIQHEQITHIDLVYAGRLDARQQNELAQPARNVGIGVTFHGLDQLVNAVVDDIRLAKALNMPIDTGQILTVAEFIDHYERGRLTVGTPLSNAYLERAEFNSMTEQLVSSEILVIQGQPGCGKTKLAIEYIQRYISERPDSEGYCIVNQPPAIWDDVMIHFPDGKDYVILIDDANRQVDNLLTVLNHFNRLRTSTYKILITVRGYAFDEVSQSLQTNNFRFSELTVGKMSDEQITEVLKSPTFTILNGIYHNKINRLAEGNVRLAVMLATLANQKGSDITILSDVSAVYDEYYLRVMPDQTVWTNTTRLQVLGLTAMLRVVDTTSLTDFEHILSFLGITATELWGHIRYLETLEIVEVYQDNAFRFTEQVFATYAFYQCTYKRKALDLARLLGAFNESQSYRLKDAVLSIYESYNKESVKAWVQPILAKFYGTLSDDQSRLSFLSRYDRFLLDEVILFIYQFVEGSVTSNTTNRYGQSVNKEIVALLFEFLAHTSKKANALVGYALMIALIDKQSVLVEDVNKKIESYLTRSFNYSEDDGPHFDQYDWLSAYLVERGLQGSALHCLVMDNNLKHFLLLMYDKPGEPPVYRKRIWGYVDHRLSAGVETIKQALYAYMPKGYRGLDNDYIQADVDEVSNVVRKHFSADDPLDCRNVHKYVHKLNNLALERRTYQGLATEFNGELYQLYCTLSFEHIKKRERRQIDISGSIELRKRKVDEIRVALSFNSLDEFRPLYEKIRLMWSLVFGPGDVWHLSEGLTEFFLSIAQRDKELFNEVLKYVLLTGLPDGYMDHPPLLATVMERHFVKPEDLYTTLLPVTDKTASWLLSFFWSLPDSEFSTQWFSRLSEKLSDLAIFQLNRIAIPGFLERYVSFDFTLPTRVIQLLHTVKSEHNKEIQLWDSFIEKFGSQVDSSLTHVMEQLYLDQYFTKEAYDHDRKALAVLLDRRRSFWHDFLIAHYDENSYLRHDFGQLSFVWSRDDYYELVSEGLQLIQKRELYIIHAQQVEGFFESLDSKNAEKVGKFIERFIQENSREVDLLNAIYLALSKPGPPTEKPFITLFLTYNTLVEDFTRIDWIKSGAVRTYTTSTIIGELRAKQWENILEKVEAMDNPLMYILHRRYIKERIVDQLEHANYERRVNFLRSR
ncbi:hypothetical protein M0L20_28705 [Spirosoma sp. RP8]|uniref:Novel STAND NTPase 3 domain-containing protein n=1 Tax=Spirosoma liriopis TaxID=2937440 RepID=A0ABT0HUN0_9BACT|nr:hypothetical protein [Spirosoma liriopis]MCK8495881.1 hypothetical protein [Spirosoma liriopis]